MAAKQGFAAVDPTNRFVDVGVAWSKSMWSLSRSWSRDSVNCLCGQTTVPASEAARVRVSSTVDSKHQSQLGGTVAASKSTHYSFEHPEFNIVLSTADTFVRAPDPGLRDWLLSRAVQDLSADLKHLDDMVVDFVPGGRRGVIHGDWTTSSATFNEHELLIEDQQVMQDWERPYMKAMADVVSATHGDVLEVGFGMGISASYIQATHVRSHTIIECNVDVMDRCRSWRREYLDRDIRLISGRWQDIVGDLGTFDSILFDTYPMSETEFDEHVLNDATYAAHFFSAAAMHLRPGGVLSYYSNETDSVSRAHQRALFQHFTEVSFRVIRSLRPPADCSYCWADSLVLTRCTK
jgi:hypothetical protein